MEVDTLFLRILDLFFLIFHTALMFFNMLGWIFRRLWKWHLFTLTLTLFSWFVLGYWYGWGYCFCTDWHWQVKRLLGESNLPNSYIVYLFHAWLNIDLSTEVANSIAIGGLLLGCIGAFWRIYIYTFR